MKTNNLDWDALENIGKEIREVADRVNLIYLFSADLAKVGSDRRLSMDELNRLCGYSSESLGLVQRVTELRIELDKLVPPNYKN